MKIERTLSEMLNGVKSDYDRFLLLEWMKEYAGFSYIMSDKEKDKMVEVITTSENDWIGQSLVDYIVDDGDGDFSADHILRRPELRKYKEKYIGSRGVPTKSSDVTIGPMDAETKNDFMKWAKGEIDELQEQITENEKVVFNLLQNKKHKLVDNIKVLVDFKKKELSELKNILSSKE